MRRASDGARGSGRRCDTSHTSIWGQYGTPGMQVKRAPSLIGDPSFATTPEAGDAAVPPATNTALDPTIATMLDRLAAATAGMIALRADLEAGEPWPLAESFGPEPEAHWGPREVLAHCAEMLPYWVGEIERIIDGPEPARYGRLQTDQIRIGLIERDRTLPIRELLARIDDGSARFGRRLAELGSADLARRGLHPVRGEQTIEQVLEVVVVGHMEGHLDQLRETLAERS